MCIRDSHKEADLRKCASIPHKCGTQWLLQKWRPPFVGLKYLALVIAHIAKLWDVYCPQKGGVERNKRLNPRVNREVRQNNSFFSHISPEINNTNLYIF